MTCDKLVPPAKRITEYRFIIFSESKERESTADINRLGVYSTIVKIFDCWLIFVDLLQLLKVEELQISSIDVHCYKAFIYICRVDGRIGVVGV